MPDCKKIACCPISPYGYEIDRGNPNPPPISAYTLTITVDPTDSGETSGGGVYTSGQYAVILATPAEGYEFTGWSGGFTGTQNPSSVFMDSDKDVTAIFSVKKVTLSIISSPSGGGTVNGAGVYNYGDVVVVTATPSDNYDFLSFSGDINTTDNPTNVTMDGDKNVVANFNRPIYTLSLSTNPIQGGSVSGNGQYTSGTEVNIYAYPNDQFAFSNWSGDINTGDNPAVITVNSDKSAIANFTKTILCSTLQNSGGQGFESYEVNLGIGTGTVALSYDAFSIPDRFTVTWGGVTVIDTGFVGDGDAVDPDTGLTYNQLLISMGYPPVSGPGAGVASFIKDTTSPELATVSVFGPLPGTNWRFTLGCPSSS